MFSVLIRHAAVLAIYYSPQHVLHVSVILFTGVVSVPACTTGRMTGGFSVQRVSVWGSLSRGDSVWEGLCPAGSLLGRPLRQRPPHSNKQAACILLECILVCFRVAVIPALEQVSTCHSSTCFTKPTESCTNCSKATEPSKNMDILLL